MVMTDRRVVVVTGGAGGIGTTIVRSFAEQGDSVAVVDTNAELLDDVVRTTDDLAAQVVGFPADVANETAVADAVRAIQDRFGRVDVLVNGAAIIARGDVLTLGVDDWRRTLEVNLTGTFLMSQMVAREMASGGAIVNIGSINANRLNPNIVAYGVSKAGVAALTQGLAVALAPRGIRVNGIIGGHVLTNFSKSRLEVPGEREKVVDSIPLHRLGEARDFAAAAMFLASDAAAWITGAMLPVDGGWLALDPTAAIPKT
jgi:NAD(P)-dependent dehydrogenase (short-subunit alcohol dehydrogenase family)